MQQRALETREALLVAAAGVFERRGYAAATVAEILQEAGVTKGAAYFHFDSKEALARAIVAEQFTWRTHDGHAGHEQTGIQEVIDLSYRFAHALKSNPLVRASVRLSIERNTFVSQPGEANPYDLWIRDVSALLSPVAEAGDLRSHSAQDAAYTVVAAIVGLQLISASMTRREDVVERFRDMWAIVLPALLSPRALKNVRVSPQ